MRQIGLALFALLLVGVAFFGSYAGMQSRDARDRDVQIQHHATQDRYNPNSAVAAGHQTKTTPEQGKEHSKNRDFFGPEWFLVLVSVVLATVTYLLFRATSKLASDSRDLSIKATATLVGMERAYLTGGGDVQMRGGRKQFRVEVANYGKTGAFLSGFYVGFATRNQLDAGQPLTFERYIFDDRIPPGGKTKVLEFVTINHLAPEIICGGFLYRDLQTNRHKFRFILRIHPDGHTRTDVARVDMKYRK